MSCMGRAHLQLKIGDRQFACGTMAFFTVDGPDHMLYGTIWRRRTIAIAGWLYWPPEPNAVVVVVVWAPFSLASFGWLDGCEYFLPVPAVHSHLFISFPLERVVNSFNPSAAAAAYNPASQPCNVVVVVCCVCVHDFPHCVQSVLKCVHSFACLFSKNIIFIQHAEDRPLPLIHIMCVVHHRQTKEYYFLFFCIKYFFGIC